MTSHLQPAKKGRAKLKFGLFNFGAWHETQSQVELYEDCVEQAVLADELGFDSIWLGEHHFSRHGIFADTMVLASHIAAKTSRLRIGTAVIVLPFHNPVRVAEQVAMVDILSGGRVDVGVGSGYQRREFAGLKVPIAEARERFREALDVMLHAWTDSTLVYEGKFTRLTAEDDIQVHPKPVQKPHPPIYQAVSTTPASVEFAASRGIPIMVGGPTDILGIAPQVIALWRSKMVEYGNDPAGYDLPCMKGVYVAPTDEEAEEDLRHIDQLWDLKILEQVGSPISPAGDIPPGYEAWVNRTKDRASAEGRAANAGTPPLVGSPETVAARLKMLQDSGINDIFGHFGMFGMPQSKKLRSIRLFAAEVMPQFRGPEDRRNPVRVRLGAT
jgi:alkanesulfonate monooxygenase SsuD/methylene tetrahydromethanopterin reductase-like flavin-dependent oxidoreductase (luciferase family)